MPVFSSILQGRAGQNPLTKSISASLDTTLTLDEAIAHFIEVTASLTANVNLIIPATADDIGQFWAIYNNTSGSFTLTVKGSSGTGVAIAQGRTGIVRWNGTNMVAHVDDASLMNGATKGANTNITSLTGITSGITLQGGLNVAGALGGNSAASAPLTFAAAAVSYASDANKTLTAAEYAAPLLVVTSAVSLTATRNLVVPLTAGAVWIVVNTTTGGQSIQVIGATGTGVTIATGKTALVRADGTNIVRITADNP